MTPPEIIATVGAMIVPSILRSDAKIDSVRSELMSKLDSKVEGLRADLWSCMSIPDKIAYDHHGSMTCLEAWSVTEPENGSKA